VVVIGSVFRPHVAPVKHVVDYIGAFFLTVLLGALVLITSLGGSLLPWASLDVLCLALFASASWQNIAAAGIAFAVGAVIYTFPRRDHQG